MKIAFLDLSHTTRGVHNITVPLGSGLIARYLQKTLGGQFDIKIFKDACLALNILSSWKPDVLGIAQYSWNSELNLYVAKIIKESNPGCLVVAGGPNLDLVTSRRIDFFKKYPFVDICILYDGEIPFAGIVKQLLSGKNAKEMRKTLIPGAYSFDPDSGRLVESPEKPPRLDSLDAFGPVYKDGIFDSFLDKGYAPFLQTHRGCPFTCAFCHTADKYHSRILFLSSEIFRQDMEYLGKQLSGRHEIILYFANPNMSFFPQDFTIAKIVREIQEKYDWPRFIITNSGKNPDKLLEMLSIIKFQPGIALQTLTPVVLQNIKRRNIPFDDFVSFQHKALKETGEMPSTELILCLPGETKETFLKTLKAVLNSGIQNVVIYTLMNLKGTLMSSEEYARRYGHLIRHRVVPREFSRINADKILDTEEVIVGTNTMPFQDYLELRKLNFTVMTFFNAAELVPLKRLLIEYQVDIAQWIFDIHSRLPEFPELNSFYEKFVQETKDELFATKEALLEFFNKEENFHSLCEGRLGDNLLRKYKYMVLSSCYKTVLRLALSEARKLLSEKINKDKTERLLNDINSYLLSCEVKGIFENSACLIDKKCHLNYDIPSWILESDSHARLENFSGSFEYLVKFDEGINQKARDFLKMNKDPELSLQILYRDGNIKDFWPKWIPYDGNTK